MTSKGHRLSGLVCFFFPLSAQYLYDFPYYTYVLSFLGVMLGVNAPDYLEIRYTKRVRKRTGIFSSREINASCTVLKHRGVTHILLYWLISLVYFFLVSFYYDDFGQYSYDIFTARDNNQFFYFFCFSYCYGGFLHLLGDIPNKTGIPLIPFVQYRFCLKLWRSSDNEIFMCFWLFVFSLLMTVNLYDYKMDSYITDLFISYINIIVKSLI